MNLELGHHNDQPRRSDRSKAFWTLAVIATVSAFLVVTRVTNYTHHFRAHIAKHRILRHLQEQPALRFTVDLKRKAMYVHGVSTFDLVVTPAQKLSAGSSSMAYNGIASFETDRYTHTYSLVDGTTYYTRHQNSQSPSDAQTECLPSSSMPPLQSVLKAIETATTAPQSRSSNDKCPNGSVMVFQFAGENFVLCSHQSSWPWFQDDGFQIFGKHVNIGVKYEQFAPIIVTPHVSTETLLSCGKVSFGDRIPPSLTSLVTRSFFEWSHRSLRTAKAEFDFFDNAWDLVTDETCGCKGVQRPCVFVAGLSSRINYGLTEDDPQEYFGDDIGDHTPCCSSRKYITLATKEYHWDDPFIQQYMVDLLCQVSDTSDSSTRIVKDTIIIGHSMANLILSGAIVNEKVILDPSTTWVAASAPMMGSMGSNYIQETCNDEEDGFATNLVDLLGNCPVNTGEKSLAFQNSSLSSPQLNDAYTAAQTAYAANVDAVICSNSFTGLASMRTAIYALAGQIIPHHSDKNDGIVEYKSCAMGLPLDTFDVSYKSRHYVTELNHVDTSFRNGDGVFGDARKPLKWLECLL